MEAINDLEEQEDLVVVNTTSSEGGAVTIIVENEETVDTTSLDNVKSFVAKIRALQNLSEGDLLKPNRGKSCFCKK